MIYAPCPRTGQWIGGCKFEGRYDQVIPKGFIRHMTEFEGSVKSLTVPVYVRDICVRCGRTVERGDREGEA